MGKGSFRSLTRRLQKTGSASHISVKKSATNRLLVSFVLFLLNVLRCKVVGDDDELMS